MRIRTDGSASRKIRHNDCELDNPEHAVLGLFLRDKETRIRRLRLTAWVERGLVTRCIFLGVYVLRWSCAPAGHTSTQSITVQVN